MPSLRDLKAVQPQLDTLSDAVKKLVDGKGKATSTPTEAKKIKAAANAVLSKVTKLNKAGKPTNPIDAAIASTLKANSKTIVSDIRAVAAKRTPSPLDYYATYYKVLRDSGLLSNGLPEPGQLGVIATAIERKAGGSIFGGAGGVYASICDACVVCAACSGCSACSVCSIGGVYATAVVGATTGLIGAAADWFA